MSKIVELSPKSQKWIYIIIGTVNSAIGIRIFYHSNSLLDWELILSIMLVTCGPILLLYGLLLFWLSPKLGVDNQGIFIKEGIFKAKININWNDVKLINYKPYELGFLLADSRIKSFVLNTNAEASLEIKRTIRRFAEQRNINVVSG
jgi:hypothetical protein